MFELRGLVVIDCLRGCDYRIVSFDTLCSVGRKIDARRLSKQVAEDGFVGFVSELEHCVEEGLLCNIDLSLCGFLCVPNLNRLGVRCGERIGRDIFIELAIDHVGLCDGAEQGGLVELDKRVDCIEQRFVRRCNLTFQSVRIVEHSLGCLKGGNKRIFGSAVLIQVQIKSTRHVIEFLQFGLVAGHKAELVNLGEQPSPSLINLFLRGLRTARHCGCMVKRVHKGLLHTRDEDIDFAVVNRGLRVSDDLVEDRLVSRFCNRNFTLSDKGSVADCEVIEQEAFRAAVAHTHRTGCKIIVIGNVDERAVEIGHEAIAFDGDHHFVFTCCVDVRNRNFSEQFEAAAIPVFKHMGFERLVIRAELPEIEVVCILGTEGDVCSVADNGELRCNGVVSPLLAAVVHHFFALVDKQLSILVRQSGEGAIPTVKAVHVEGQQFKAGDVKGADEVCEVIAGGCCEKRFFKPCHTGDGSIFIHRDDRVIRNGEIDVADLELFARFKRCHEGCLGGVPDMQFAVGVVDAEFDVHFGDLGLLDGDVGCCSHRHVVNHLSADGERREDNICFECCVALSEVGNCSVLCYSGNGFIRAAVGNLRAVKRD